MSKRIKLETHFDIDFCLFGIFSQERDIKICWNLNKLFSLDFVRQDDIEIISKINKNQIGFSVFLHVDEETGLYYYLLSNRSGKSYLLPEMDKVDYLLKIKGETEIINENEILQKLRSEVSIITAISIAPDSLKHIENIIF